MVMSLKKLGNNKFKRKLAEALHIKHGRPTLSVQEESMSLKLFN